MRVGIQKKTAHALEQEGEDILKRRQDWFNGHPDLDPRRLVFIDETSFSKKMALLVGGLYVETVVGLTFPMAILRPLCMRVQ